ncbi:hypothetical protein PC116_g9287 [Phytophthora cactorum]|uniref:Uncharacterized protein n=1 Tax=Phytophthora cactorum TaxID=29920 RepID=A0A329R7U8_9STRA|nr:hypothetical protein Pcac1_g8896 [Phytophthora cactorum]KAG2853726.1 hypothetical protein PC113_g13925 [Phytophthora cactorum]KAG2893234.1 hypothetical protein PC114_g16333 [Phytophthora cactorum]KAG2899285.1 hypothetical protein PC117_g22302 [Phytophthora cactorum]KAG2976984.1 hypothetical protein PC119_g22036 [Phytophthora cactorum]
MPSFKTASCEQYLERLKYFWHHVEFLMHICVDRPFLKRKFFQKRMARVAVDKIARRIVPTVSRLTCVAYGDWSRRDGIKGHAPSPVKGLKEALRKRYSGLHGRVQDEQALIAVPPNASGSSLLYGYEAPKTKEVQGRGVGPQPSGGGVRG